MKVDVWPRSYEPDPEDWAELARLNDKTPKRLPGLVCVSFWSAVDHYQQYGDLCVDCWCVDLWDLVRQGFEAHPEAREDADDAQLLLLEVSPPHRNRLIERAAQRNQGR